MRARNILVWILIAFGIYAIFKSPDQAAGIVASAVDGLVGAVRAVGTFFDALLGLSS